MDKAFVLCLFGKLAQEWASVDQGVAGFVKPEIIGVDVSRFHVGDINPAQDVLATFGPPAIDVVAFGDILIRAREIKATMAASLAFEIFMRVRHGFGTFSFVFILLRQIENPPCRGDW